MELMQKIFEGVENSDELLKKATVLVEAEINEKVDAKVALLTEETLKGLDEKFAQREEAFITESTEKVSTFLDQIVVEWAKDNAVAIDSNIKADISTMLIESLKDTFLKANVKLPTEGNAELVTEMTQKLEESESKNKELQTRLDEQEKVEIQRQRETVLAEAVVGLADTQVDRIKRLAESFSFNSIDEYKEKVGILIEAVSDKKDPDSSDKDGKDGKDGDGVDVVDKDGKSLDSDKDDDKQVDEATKQRLAALKLITGAK